MKKIKLEGKLCLNKETVSKLNNAQMEIINGGFGGTWAVCGVTNTCVTWNFCNTPTASCPEVCIPATRDCQRDTRSVCHSCGIICP
jgi:hypothetical protein